MWSPDGEDRTGALIEVISGAADGGPGEIVSLIMAQRCITAHPSLVVALLKAQIQANDIIHLNPHAALALGAAQIRPARYPDRHWAPEQRGMRPGSARIQHAVRERRPPTGNNGQSLSLRSRLRPPRAPPARPYRVPADGR